MPADYADYSDRDLTHAVREALGWHVLAHICGPNGNFFVTDKNTAGVFKFSTDIRAAWELVKKIGKRPYNAVGIRLLCNGNVEVFLHDGDGHEEHLALAPTAPRAICLALLRWKEEHD